MMSFTQEAVAGSMAWQTGWLPGVRGGSGPDQELGGVDGGLGAGVGDGAGLGAGAGAGVVTVTLMTGCNSMQLRERPVCPCAKS
jgi:hypothetical protein